MSFSLSDPRKQSMSILYFKTKLIHRFKHLTNPYIFLNSKVVLLEEHLLFIQPNCLTVFLSSADVLAGKQLMGFPDFSVELVYR